MRRRKDLDLYQPAEDGKTYVYQGAYYKLSVPEEKKRLLRIKLFAFSFLALALLIVSGLINPDGLRQLYVVFPYLAALYYGGKAVLQSISAMGMPDLMTLRQKNQSFVGLRHSSRMLVIFALLFAFTQSVYFVFFNRTLAEGLVVLFGVLTALFAYRIFSLLSKYPCVENKA